MGNPRRFSRSYQSTMVMVIFLHSILFFCMLKTIFCVRLSFRQVFVKWDRERGGEEIMFARKEGTWSFLTKGYQMIEFLLRYSGLQKKWQLKYFQEKAMMFSRL